MEMITDHQLEELPEDDLEAFIAFDAILREQFKFGRSQNMKAEREYAVYMLAFSEQRKIDLDVEDELPAKDIEFKPYFDRLISRVNVTKEKIRLAQAAQRKINGTTFRIATNFKAQIGGHLNAIRNIVEKSDHLSEDKRDAIFARIEKLQAEVNRDRTKSEVVVGLWLDITSAISNGAKNLDPAIDRLERIMKILGVARDDDATARLPAPQEPKQIPPPPSQGNDDGEM
jgi:hypothetical protein